MPRSIALTFVSGFGLELGAIYSMALWPEVEHVAVPLAFIGAGMMTFAALFHK